MLRAIILENGASGSAAERAVEVLRSRGIESTLIQTAEAPVVAKAVAATLKTTRADSILFVDARAALSEAEVDKLAFDSENEICGYAAFELAGELIDLPELSKSSLVGWLSSDPAIPSACFFARLNLISDIIDSNSSSYAELIARIIVKAIAEDESVSRSSEVSIATAYQGNFNSTLDAAAAAACISQAVNSCNIEDLYPNQAWDKFEEESAAASYHALAAVYLKLGDADAAQNCIDLSERFEDSPRSLALKGLIALTKGETLGAVANMVSSLQSYELRKKGADDDHYINFEPKDLEGINKKLSEGLAALNRRDNEPAIQHFKQAVFDFDAFYSEFGIDK